MKKKIYYKVVQCDLVSCVITEPKFMVQYELNEWVKPKIKGTKLMVFNNLLSAQMFIYCLSDWYINIKKIYECEVSNIQKIAPFVYSTNGRFLKNKLENILKLQSQKKRYSHLNRREVPSGTVFVDKVRLTKQVSNT